MAFVLSSLSGNLISAASAGYAPTNSADVSAIASAYQVVSSTATQLYAGSAYLTSVNETPISAARAGNAANASLANSAWYDGTGRLISSLPDEATVSGIASAYAKSAASSKQDTLSFSYDDDKISAINGSALAGQGGGGGLVTAIGTSESGITSLNNSGLVDTAALRSADYSSLYVQEPLYISASGDSSYIGISGDVGGIDSATCSAIASAYAESAASSKLDTTAQVVTSTATQLYAGTTYLTSVNGTPISAARAGNAANASMSNSAYYDGTGRLISALPDSATVSAIASSYVESGVSSKQDTLSFAYNTADQISSINGSALAGQGGGASIPFQGTYWDSATSATADITADVSSISSLAYTKHDGTVVNTYKGITDSLGIHHLGVASFIAAGAEINGKNPGVIHYTMAFAPASSMWTTSGAATGIFSPLQYGTGAGMFMDNSNYKGYLKGNEWFVANTLYGYARGEVHQNRGSRVIVEHTGGAGAVLSAYRRDANVTLNNHDYGTAKMAVANSQAYVQVQRGNSDSKYNSAKLDTDYLKFYSDMTTGYLDPEDTASGTAYMPAETEYMYISSIPYWNGKADSSALSSYALSADVSGTVDLVSTQSANWGGSALQLSAGAGISLTLSGNVLIIATAEA